jgi:hypothetical protein
MRVPLQVHAFRKLLVQETDETKRQMLFISLAQEEAKLKALLGEWSAKCDHAAGIRTIRQATKHHPHRIGSVAGDLDQCATIPSA